MVQNTFDSWKYQLLCNKMSNMENSYKLRLKTILKQHHFNINGAQMNKYSSMQILISIHMDRFVYEKFAYMQIEICTWPQTGANFKNICTCMQICPCECTFS